MLVNEISAMEKGWDGYTLVTRLSRESSKTQDIFFSPAVIEPLKRSVF
jgi:hypothetical protein